MKNILFLSMIWLLLLGHGVAVGQDKGQSRSYKFLKNDFVKIFNDWSDASVDNDDDAPPAAQGQGSADRERRLSLMRDNVMSIMDYHNIVNSRNINDMIVQSNHHGNGWMGFFEGQVNEGMPFQIRLRSADFVGLNGNEFWFLVRYAIRYMDRCDWSSRCRYNPLDTVHYVCRNIEVEDFMCVRNDYVAGCIIKHIQSDRPVVLEPPSFPMKDRDFQISTFTEMVCGVEFKMVLVETEDGGNSAVPDRNYYIGQLEVTQQLWDSVMGVESNPSHFKGGSLPVENITWAQAQEFVLRLNELTGRNYRLPSEKEWMFAASGGLKSHGYAYSGSGDCDAVAWHLHNTVKTRSVGLLKANELDIYDMSGNVWEWCADSYDVLTKQNMGLKVDPSSKYSHATLGGGYNTADCKLTSHVLRDERQHSNNIGMRLAL